MTEKTVMQYFLYTAVKEFPHGNRILALLLRTQGERFHPLQHDPGIKGAECQASVAMKWQQHIFDEIFRTAQGSGKPTALPIPQLGGAVGDHVPDKVNGPLWPGRGTGLIEDQDRNRDGQGQKE